MNLISKAAAPLLAAIPIAMNTPAAERNVDGLMDNSFLIEEAYNQEAGVVQHVFTMFGALDRKAGDDDQVWDLTFSQEWPIFSQRHQFSYSIPYSFLDEDGDRENGLGDIAIEYRWQAYLKEETWTALAPKVGLVFPTGNERRGLGEGSIGLAWGLPFSTAPGDNWFAHLNVGGEFVPDAHSLGGRSAYEQELGGSVGYAPSPTLHFLLEALATWGEELDRRGRRTWASGVVLSPGVRKAINSREGAQWVFGVAVPFGIGGNAPDFGAFLYVSFEHKFIRDE